MFYSVFEFKKFFGNIVEEISENYVKNCILITDLHKGTYKGTYLSVLRKKKLYMNS